MFEETNQMMEESEVLDNLPENLFDDEDEGTGTEASTPGDNGAGENSDTVTKEASDKRDGGNHTGEALSPAESVLRVKFNGEERDLSFEEARKLAQKGLNYDHVAEERDRNRNAFNFLMERAKNEGITVEQLIANERGRAENQRLEAKMQEIRSRDDDASEETIKSLAQFELEAEKRQKEKEREQAEAQALENKKSAETEGWNRLFREHPELVAKEGEQVSPEVVGLFDLIGQGYTPVEAYYIKRNRELEVQNKMKEDASAAKSKSIGSLSGNQNPEAEDPFLAGFNSV